ncbi:sugar kinase [Coralloluteibacterium stylophorae]|uniref:Sugar kinase n=1 Tax=Coralloluteibacterium stylophorae TaxID=1776034 RepID=A0A8J7VT02_9GAMM|nr:sugar kinase [Coralloluteibacterium stylophorae]MBS7458173.1 sugar kinase [Coralloluteibacterium stylophorae]
MAARIVCFGELLLRLSAPGRQLLLQSPQLDVHVGGAEANVAVALARWGHAVRFASVVADNPLGGAALGELRRHGVDTARVLRAPGRMGLYFLSPGAVHRASEVVYDRARSAFAEAAADAIDWDAALEGADHFHLSGVTPALGPASAEAALRAARAARAAGLTVSFDGNYRGRLWQAWQGDAPALLRQLMAEADIAFADHRDFALVLGRSFDAEDPERRFAEAADAAFAAFPNLRRIACTRRDVHSVDHHALCARMAVRDGARHATPGYTVAGIVDRIGGGDAFAAGVLHGLRSGMDDDAALRFGLASGVLKHSLPGDFMLLDASDIAAFVATGQFDVRR